MKTRMRKGKLWCIHIEDSDAYEVTGDNGVDFWPTKNQLLEIANRQEQHP
jgi:hypothetical protein